MKRLLLILLAISVVFVGAGCDSEAVTVDNITDTSDDSDSTEEVIQRFQDFSETRRASSFLNEILYFTMSKDDGSLDLTVDSTFDFSQEENRTDKIAYHIVYSMTQILNVDHDDSNDIPYPYSEDGASFISGSGTIVYTYKQETDDSSIISATYTWDFNNVNVEIEYPVFSDTAVENPVKCTETFIIDGTMTMTMIPGESQEVKSLMINGKAYKDISYSTNNSGKYLSATCDGKDVNLILVNIV